MTLHTIGGLRPVARRQRLALVTSFNPDAILHEMSDCWDEDKEPSLGWTCSEAGRGPTWRNPGDTRRACEAAEDDREEDSGEMPESCADDDTACDDYPIDGEEGF